MDRPDESLSLRLLREIGSAPTAPYHEDAAISAVVGELARLDHRVQRDHFGNVLAEVRRGDARHALALTAHLDHPGFEVVAARGRSGRARIRGGLFARSFRASVGVLVQRPEQVIQATLSDFVAEPERPNWSSGHARIDAEEELRVGDWAILDLPGFERDGDDVHLRAADDLAGCALILATLHLLAAEERPHHVHALFTRAEEPGLFGARLAIEGRVLPPDALVVSLEASRALPGAEPAKGPVIRVGDLHHTFDDRAESYLRVARERLARERIPAQRQLMYGGSCDGSAFLDAGYRTTALALPLRNYHNDGPDGPAAEIISLSDFRAGAALLAEGAAAAAEEATEEYRVHTGRVPEEIRQLLG